MNTSVKDFIENRNISTLEVKPDDRSWGYYLVKVKLDDRFDYLFKGYSDINFDKHSLEIFGLLDNETKIVYTNTSYFIEKLLPNVEWKDLYQVTSEIESEIKRVYNESIYKDVGGFKSDGYKAYKEYKSYEENQASIQNKAQEYYIHNDFPDRAEFDIYTYSYRGKDGIADTKTIIDYITDSKTYILNKVQEILSQDDDYIYSSVSGIPNITVTRKQKIGFELLVRDEIRDIIKVLETDKDSLFTKKREIIEALQNDNMKTVNVTVINNGEELTYKYPADTLRRLYISAWNIPDTTVRAKYEKLFSDKYYYDDLVIAKIIKITYGKNTLYEGKDISKE